MKYTEVREQNLPVGRSPVEAANDVLLSGAWEPRPLEPFFPDESSKAPFLSKPDDGPRLSRPTVHALSCYVDHSAWAVD